MHENEISHKTIGAAIEVHRILGPGLVESVYEESLCCEFDLRGIRHERQKRVPIIYKGKTLKSPLKLDLLVEGKVIVDLKAKEVVLPIDREKVLTYLRLCDLRLGLIINLHESRLVDGVERIINGILD